MASVLSVGKYRSRKDWSTNSIPTLVSLEEENITTNHQVIENLSNGIPPKPPRRSSLAIGLLNGRNHNVDKSNKRRSSIAVATFLGRRDHKNRENNYEVPVISEHNFSHDIKIKITEPIEDVTEDKRRRRLSLHEKFRKRKKGQIANSSKEDLENQHIIGNGNHTNGGFSGSQNGLNNDIEYVRQKRPSWWNIFLPDKQSRARRASQDVGIVARSNDNLAPIYPRSKSRSVDHGLAAPFDLDSLRSKVEGRFESVDRLSKDGSKSRSTISIPTTTYTVGNRDTLTSVAARFDTTPSELTSLNRLTSSFIYPGQQLLVPDKENQKDDSSQSQSGHSSPTKSFNKVHSNDDLPQEEKELLDGLRPASPKPGHIERVSSPNTKTDDDDPVITQRFLKINVRHITDGQGVVGGVLLVTPNAVMFDPNVSDPLVIEHGPESYGVIAPMELVVNAAIFHDIAHMRVGDAAETNLTEKPEVYYPPSFNRYENTHSPGKDSLLVKDETFPELGVGSLDAGDDQESVCSSTGREGDAFPKAFERELVTPTNLQRTHDEQISTESCGSTDAGPGNQQISDSNKKIIDTKDLIDSGSNRINQIKSSTECTTTTQSSSQSIMTTTDTNKTDEMKKSEDGLKEVKSLEERRKSLLDHHWAVPSKDSSLEDKDESETEALGNASISGGLTVGGNIPQIVPQINEDEISQLVKLSCHDSGIDIRDPNSIIPAVQPLPSKKVYSDAEIVLSNDWVPPLTIAPTHFSDSPPKQSNLGTSGQHSDASGRKKTSSVSFSIEDNENQSANLDKTSDTKKNKMLKRLSYPLSWVEGLTGETNKSIESTDSAPNTGDSNQSVFSKVFSRRSSIGTFIRPHSSEGTHPVQKPSKAATPKLDYRSMVSIDDMPELFVSFDKLIPRPARACPDPPLYLRLRMGRPLGKAPPLPTSVMSYGKNKLRPEYWFSIPKNRVDELYRFLNSWVPQLYGDLDEEQVTSRGYELIQHDTEWGAQGEGNKDGRSNSDGEITELTRESWEVLSMSTDDYRKATIFSTGSFDQDFPIPELIGTTEILTEEHREKLCSHLPARAEGYAWSLVFSTSQHGFSLNTLYRKMQKLETPVLIVIQDTDNNVFGALTSCPLHVSDHFYGTGESLLYKFNPHFKVFHWSGENLYFIKGNPESLAIGAGDGKFGLWLDGDLNQGRSQRCSTYSNEPLAPQEDFVIKTLECWAFV